MTDIETLELRIDELCAELEVKDTIIGQLRSAIRARMGGATRVRVYVDERRCIGHDECSACGQVLPPTARFCPWCGAMLGGDA